MYLVTLFTNKRKKIINRNLGASLIAQSVKNLPAMQDTQVQFLRQEDPLEKANGNPLQYSCLENPMDRGAWQAAVHGVTRVRHDLATKPPPLNIKNKI